MTIAEAVTFLVSDVGPAATSLPEVPYKQAVETLLTPVPPERGDWDDEDEKECEGLPEFAKQFHKSRVARRIAQGVSQTPPLRSIEACTRYHGRLLASVAFHPVLAAVHHAFNDHRPLRLGPDAVWLMVIQAVANHINARSEEFRGRFVQHEGQATIIVRRDDFVKGSPENPWPEVFHAFSAAIREHVGPAVDRFEPTFSTTGPVERAAAEVVLLDALQSYFRYEFHTLCGIPSITLEGTTADWEALAERVEEFAELDLETWVGHLRPILAQFVRASRGDVDASFWQSIYKLNSQSGGPVITGWITAFFPYLKNRQTGRADEPFKGLLKPGNDYIEKTLYPPDPKRSRGDWVVGLTLESLPGGLSRAPFLWKYLGRDYPMEFLGGFVGVAQDEETLALRPEIGWAVREAE